MEDYVYIGTGTWTLSFGILVLYVVCLYLCLPASFKAVPVVVSFSFLSFSVLSIPCINDRKKLATPSAILTSVRLFYLHSMGHILGAAGSPTTLQHLRNTRVTNNMSTWYAS